MLKSLFSAFGLVTATSFGPETIAAIRETAQNLVDATSDDEQLLFIDPSTEGIFAGIQHSSEAFMLSMNHIPRLMEICRETFVFVNNCQTPDFVEILASTVLASCPRSKIEMIQLVFDVVPDLPHNVKTRAIVYHAQACGEWTQENLELIRNSRTDVIRKRRTSFQEDRVKLFEYIPDAPEHITIPVAYFVNRVKMALEEELGK